MKKSPLQYQDLSSQMVAQEMRTSGLATYSAGEDSCNMPEEQRQHGDYYPAAPLAAGTIQNILERLSSLERYRDNLTNLHLQESAGEELVNRNLEKQRKEDA